MEMAWATPWGTVRSPALDGYPLGKGMDELTLWLLPTLACLVWGMVVEYTVFKLDFGKWSLLLPLVSSAVPAHQRL